MCKTVCGGGYKCLPHITQTAHSVFSDILVRVVEVQKLQSISGTQFGPDLKQCLELRATQTDTQKCARGCLIRVTYIQFWCSSVNKMFIRNHTTAVSLTGTTTVIKIFLPVNKCKLFRFEMTVTGACFMCAVINWSLLLKHSTG